MWPALRPFGVPARRDDDADPFRALQRRMDQMLEDFGAAWPGARAGMPGPRIDVHETDTDVTVTAELPGVKPEDVDVVLSDNLLTIKGEKRQEHEERKGDMHVSERSFGSFARSLTLPFGANPDKVSASFGDGVLKVVVPKPAEEAAKARKIAIARA